MIFIFVLFISVVVSNMVEGFLPLYLFYINIIYRQKLYNFV